MNQLFVAVAIVSLAATGCVSTNQFARNNKNCGPACHVARTQSAPRPEIIRTSHTEGGLFGGMLGKHKKKSCDPGCGCDECCECTCGCPEDCCCDDECCESTCGCPEECCDPGCACEEDPGCGCEDPCCGDCCSDDRSFCQKLIDRIASGGCGGGSNGCGMCPHSGGYPATVNFNPGPPVGQTAYPYYTTRGPRDFLQNNPPSIGPY